MQPPVQEARLKHQSSAQLPCIKPGIKKNMNVDNATQQQREGRRRGGYPTSSSPPPGVKPNSLLAGVMTRQSSIGWRMPFRRSRCGKIDWIELMNWIKLKLNNIDWLNRKRNKIDWLNRKEDEPDRWPSGSGAVRHIWKNFRWCFRRRQITPRATDWRLELLYMWEWKRRKTKKKCGINETSRTSGVHGRGKNVEMNGEWKKFWQKKIK